MVRLPGFIYIYFGFALNVGNILYSESFVGAAAAGLFNK